jgi:hypothetical protein
MRAIREIVPPELLVPPMPHERHWLWRDECAVVLDGWLRRLARQEALCRRVLGTIASVFLARRAHHRLGFARIGDYARERLGISGRELQSIARVVAAMRRLPKIRAAFERGDSSWSQLRVLVDAATESTEAAWLSLARNRTVRALDALRKGKSERQASNDGDDDGVDGEPRARFQLSCPRRVSSSWRRAVEFARRMSGEELTIWQAAEAIAAEGLSALDACRDDSQTASSPDASRSAADPGEYRVAAPAIDWSAFDEAIPAPIENLGIGVDDLDDVELDDRMRTVIRSAQRVDWQIGRLLRLFLDMRLHQLMGFDSACAYVRERLGVSARKARALVHLERKTSPAPELAAAYRAGEISWVRALALIPVLSDAHARTWVERAKSVTVRRLVDEVEWAVETRDMAAAFVSIAPPPPGVALVLPEWQMCAREERPTVDAEIGFTGPASTVALLDAAIAAFGRGWGARWRALERLLDHVIGEWTRQPAHRDPVFARDRWRCAVPACSSRRNLHDHHILFRSRGGDNARGDRVTVCAWHHLRGLHAGAVRAYGKAPDEIRWTIGSTSRGRPLLELGGDRVV